MSYVHSKLRTQGNSILFCIVRIVQGVHLTFHETFNPTSSSGLPDNSLITHLRNEGCLCHSKSMKPFHAFPTNYTTQLQLSYSRGQQIEGSASAACHTCWPPLLSPLPGPLKTTCDNNTQLPSLRTDSCYNGPRQHRQHQPYCSTTAPALGAFTS